MSENTKSTSKDIMKTFRKLHKSMASVLFIIFLLISVSGWILGWQKHGKDLFTSDKKPKTENVDKNTKWLTLDSIQQIAMKSIDASADMKISRMDIRPEKGIVKVQFKGNEIDLVLDLSTGAVLSKEERDSDFIEHLHDGSIFDHYLGTSKDWISLTYTNIAGVSLLLFVITGFWLRYGNKFRKK